MTLIGSRIFFPCTIWKRYIDNMAQYERNQNRVIRYMAYLKKKPIFRKWQSVVTVFISFIRFRILFSFTNWEAYTDNMAQYRRSRNRVLRYMAYLKESPIFRKWQSVRSIFMFLTRSRI